MGRKKRRHPPTRTTAVTASCGRSTPARVRRDSRVGPSPFPHPAKGRTPRALPAHKRSARPALCPAVPRCALLTPCVRGSRPPERTRLRPHRANLESPNSFYHVRRHPAARPRGAWSTSEAQRATRALCCAARTRMAPRPDPPSEALASIFEISRTCCIAVRDSVDIRTASVLSARERDKRLPCHDCRDISYELVS